MSLWYAQANLKIKEIRKFKKDIINFTVKIYTTQFFLHKGITTLRDLMKKKYLFFPYLKNYVR